MLAGGLAAGRRSRRRSARGAVAAARRLDDLLRRRAAAAQSGCSARGMVGVALIGGALRYWMRELLNGVSRWIEYDLRQRSVRAPRDARPDVLRAHAHRRPHGAPHERPERRAHGRGPAIMYLTNTIFGGAFALVFMLRISRGSRSIARAADDRCCPCSAILLGGAIHTRFEAVQAHFSDLTTLAQENLAGVRIVRAFRQEERRDRAVRRAERGVSREEHGARAALRHHAAGLFGIFAGLRHGRRARARRRARRAAARSRVGASSRSACTSECSPGRSSRSAG